MSGPSDTWCPRCSHRDTDHVVVGGFYNYVVGNPHGWRIDCALCDCVTTDKEPE